ncbi:hypothetical protein [Bradyrhizobium neotropicale]|uniref:hypothetical protein n=1 Tax=Bradyrhizobium neotropicale TaxID=1497615 RepID=UPI001AD63A1D|nr:hypothetical protein [Bradyrhizobium neotropicale]MBO4228375.1 hypothetical protein [Bradyrhizobium neotropicale]
MIHRPKQPDLPPEVAHAFMADMRAYFAEPNEHKRNEIAARQMHILNQHRPRRAKRLWISDIKTMFEQMRG